MENNNEIGLHHQSIPGLSPKVITISYQQYLTFKIVPLPLSKVVSSNDTYQKTLLVQTTAQFPFTKEVIWLSPHRQKRAGSFKTLVLAPNITHCFNLQDHYLNLSA